MKIRALLLILTLGLVTGGCSNQWREGDSGRSADEVAQFLSEAQGAQGQGLSSGDVATALQYSQDGTIYFGDAPGLSAGSPGPLGYVTNLLSFTDFNWLGGGMDWDNIQEARVFFLDHPNGDVDDVGLVIGINVGNGYTYYGFSGQGSVDQGEFVAELSGGSAGSIELRSWDNDGSTLNDIIQLTVYVNGQKVGKISTLIGYQ